MDFSDRVAGKRKSYKASSRRQRKFGNGSGELGDFSDEEDGESLERKMARLKREIEEIKAEIDNRNLEKKDDSDEQEGPGEADAAALSRMLHSISASRKEHEPDPGARLARALQTTLPSSTPTGQPSDAPKDGDAATYTVTYAPTFQESHVLAKATEFDGRLALLEKALGVNSAAIPTLDSKGIPITVLPRLETLQRQIAILANATPSSLDNVSRRIRTLTQEAERLAEARKSAKAAQDELRSSGAETTKTAGEEAEDSDQDAKINALYGTLPTIESLAPLLPSVLDRLRSLRTIHAEAASASESLDHALQRQEEMATDIKKWREGLERVEEAMKHGETTTSGNMKVVEGWVKELELRMAKLES